MYPNRPGRNVCRILPAGLFLVLAANSLLADSFTITGTATMAGLGISVGEQWNGTLTTDGACSVCTTAANGGLLTLSIDIYGHMISASDDDPIFYRALDTITVSNVTVEPHDDTVNIVKDGTFEIDRAEVDSASGTYFISAGSSIPEPAGIVLLSTVLVITFVTLRKKKAIRS
jgi:hypothetical protein